MTIQQIFFSPTGGTKRVCEQVCRGMNGVTVVTDLCVPRGQVHLPVLSEDDIAVIAMPVFAGRVPAIAVERLRMIESNNTFCVLVAVYGNRDYDDALLEMYDVARSEGFRPVAAIAAVAEHSIARVYAAGRPDAADCEELAAYGREIMGRLGDGVPPVGLDIPGNRPYKAANVGPFPEADERCTACGLCAAQCPAGAIPVTDLRTVDRNTCVSCMRCVAVCPAGARGIGALRDVVTERLRPLCSERRGNVLVV